MSGEVYDWYKVGNTSDFDELEIPSMEYEFILEDVGLQTVLIVNGFNLGVVYDGVFLSHNINSKNPFAFGHLEDEPHSLYIDDNNDIWLGIEVEEE
jgi:hypothetical protein